MDFLSFVSKFKKSSISETPLILGGKSESGSTKKLSYDWNQQSQLDWPSFFFQTYMETILTTPIIVAETLLNVQYQKRLLPGQEEDLPVTAYQSVEDPLPPPPMYLPRLKSDFVVTSRLLAARKYEGWTSNFKGHMCHFIYRSLFSSAQPYIEESLNDVFDVFEDQNPWTMATSTLLVGMALSPLEMVRTRLMIQSLAPTGKRYYGTFQGLYQISKEEDSGNGILDSFYNFRTLIPTMILNTISPLIRFFSTRFIEEQLGLSVTFNPILYKISQVALIGLEAFISCPLELVRARLYAQKPKIPSKSPSSDTSQTHILHEDVATCVQLSHTADSGMFNCLIKVIAEEGGRSGVAKPSTNKISMEEWQSVYGGSSAVSSDQESGVLARLAGYGRGIKSLYRGFWPRYLTLVIQFVSAEINKEDAFF